MRFLRVLSLTAPLAAGCLEEDPSSNAGVGTTSQAVLGGEKDSAFAAVVAVTLTEATNVGVGFCTGTLIAPNLVLTARHCVSNMVDNELSGVQCEPRTADGKTVPADRNGALVSAGTVALFNVGEVGPSSGAGPAVKTVLVPPGDEDAANCGHDLALLELERPWTDVAPIAPRLATPPRVHEPLTIVGYGYDGAKPNSDGVRRARSGAKVSSLGESTNSSGGLRSTDREWIVDEGPCGGDSGGPALDADGKTIGVMSRGNATACTTMIYQRIDLDADWLAQSARTAATNAGIAAPDWARSGEQIAAADADASTSAEPSAARAPTATPPAVSSGCAIAIARHARPNASSWLTLVAGIAALTRRRRRWRRQEA